MMGAAGNDGRGAIAAIERIGLLATAGALRHRPCGAGEPMREALADAADRRRPGGQGGLGIRLRRAMTHQARGSPFRNVSAEFCESEKQASGLAALTPVFFDQSPPSLAPA